MATDVTELSRESALLREVDERLGQAIAAESVSRELAYDDLKHLNGDHWPVDIKTKRERMGRPCLTLNRLPQFLDQVAGDARKTMPRIKVGTAPIAQVNRPQRIPSAIPGAAPKEYTYAEVMGGIIRDIETRSNAETAYFTALEHSAGIGWGNWRIVTDYTDEAAFGEQEIRIERILNPFAVYWDPGAVELCKEDARWCLVTERMAREVFEDEYPHAISHGGDLASSQGDPMTQWFTDDSVRVAEYFRKVPTERVILQLSDGTVIEHDDDFEQIADELEQYGIYPVKARRVPSHKIEWALVTGAEVLEQSEWAGRHIPVVFCPGKELHIDGRMIHRGIIRHGKDAQKQFNYWMTAETERIALAPKAPYTIGTSQIEGYEDIWRTSNTENHGFLPFNDERNQSPPQRVQPPTISPGEHNLVMMADSNIKATIGLYEASLGARSNEVSGRAITARQREGDTVTFPFIDNLGRAIKRTGDILVDLIPRIYDTERIVRILGVNGAEDFVSINQTILDEETGEEVLIHDLSQARYLVEVTLGPSHATARAEAADSMAQFLQAMNNPQMALAVGHLMARNMDWPGADEMADAMQKVAVMAGVAEPPPGEEQKLSPQQIAQQQAAAAQQQLDQQKYGAEMAKAEAAKAGAQASMADAQAKQMDSRVKMQQAMAPPQPERAPPPAQPNVDARLIRNLVRNSVAEAIAELIKANRGRAA